MKRILRGIIACTESDPPDVLRSNLMRLRASQVAYVRPSDKKIYAFVREFYEGQEAIPTLKTLEEYFEKANDTETQERIKDVVAASFHMRADYSHLIEQIEKEQRLLRLRGALKKADDIATKGVEIGTGRGKKQLLGVDAALGYLADTATEISPPPPGARPTGDLRDETGEAWAEYLEAKTSGSAYGRFLGIDSIDEACHGLKPGELWIHAAFPGDLKTTLALSWATNLVTRYRCNVLYISLEMPREQIRRMIYTLHSANAAFRAKGLAPLDYRRVRDGELTPEQEALYQAALRDFETNPEHCHFELWCPDGDITIRDIKREAERFHRSWEVDFIVIDHGGLVKPDSRDRDYVIRLNSVIRDAKQLALQFAGNTKTAVLMLFQINREGKKEAAKNDGKYGLHALSYSNEAERSADVITTTYLDDDLRRDGETIMCNLKNRDNPLFDPLRLSVDWRCRRIFEDLDRNGLIVDPTEDAYDGLLDQV